MTTYKNLLSVYRVFRSDATNMATKISYLTVRILKKRLYNPGEVKKLKIYLYKRISEKIVNEETRFFTSVLQTLSLETHQVKPIARTLHNTMLVNPLLEKKTETV